ncbi:MAG TPA: hypothetical protein VMN04_04225, partial [Thermoanaerobaculia bacterium]|nr:hypothetical protein [Thermoanaerobaculia bacterium]
MAEGAARAPRLSTAAALAVVLLAFGARFRDFLLGGTLYRRDAGFFFVPWRSVLERLLRAGEWPLWNDFMSGGRPLAADPNGAVFWPLSPLVLLVSPTGLALADVALLLAVFFAALRRLGLSAASAAAGTLVLLFSGVFQSLPGFLTTCAAAAPLPLAFAELSGLASEASPARRRAAATAALAFGLSLLGGEPAITLTAGVAFLALALAGARGGRAALGGAGALALGLGLAAVQVLPAGAELARSARGAGLRAEHGALFWSVRPARILTLLEPRLTGDPVAGPFWGAGASDAGSPYFDDIALGILPLLFAAAASRDRRGRAALAVAGGAAVFSFGRFLPGYGLVAKALPFVRYPEKWWVLATLALSAAAAIGVECVFFGEDETRERSRGVLLRTAGVMATLCGALLGLCFGAEEFLRRVLWTLGLGAGSASGADVARVLRMPLLSATVSLLVCAAVAGRSGALFNFEEKRRFPIVAGGLLALLFLADASRRVAGTCPAGPRDLYRRESPDVALVREQAADGRFYDDGADDPATAGRRARAAGGLDPLRPETGAVFGIRYAGENDVDRMTSAESFRWASALAALPWGEEKARALRAAGVSVVRTAAPGPDPVATEEIGRSGPDRFVRIEGARPEFALLPEG